MTVFLCARSYIDYQTANDMEDSNGPNMIFKLRKHSILTHLFEVLKEKIQDTLLHFDKDSMKIRATNHSRSFIAYVDLDGGSLDEYQCT